MKVVVMRHGDAVLGADDDASRALTPVGVAQSRAMAEWMLTQCPAIDRVLVSPYLRAQQTWQSMQDLFADAIVETVHDLVPHGHAGPVGDYLRALEGDAKQVLVISHLPLVGYLVADLCPGLTPPMFVTSAMAGVEVNAGSGSLLWQQTPQRL